jgi:hypothetical protein
MAAHVESLIVREDYHIFPGTTLGVCCLILKNGFVVTGESSAAAEVGTSEFAEKIGRDHARANALKKIMVLESYLHKQHLSGI